MSFFKKIQQLLTSGFRRREQDKKWDELPYAKERYEEPPLQDKTVP